MFQGFTLFFSLFLLQKSGYNHYLARCQMISKKIVLLSRKNFSSVALPPGYRIDAGKVGLVSLRGPLVRKLPRHLFSCGPLPKRPETPIIWPGESFNSFILTASGCFLGLNGWNGGAGDVRGKTGNTPGTGFPRRACFRRLP